MQTFSEMYVNKRKKEPHRLLDRMGNMLSKAFFDRR